MKKHPIQKALSRWMKPPETQFLQQKEKIHSGSLKEKKIKHKKKSEKSVYSERRGKKMSCSQTVRSLLLLKRKMKHVPSQIMTKTCGNICLKLSRSGSLRKPHPELSGTQSLVRGIVKRGRDVPLHPSQKLEFK